MVSSYDDEIRRVLKTGFNRMVENELLVHFQSSQIMRNLTGCRQHEPVVQKLKTEKRKQLKSAAKKKAKKVQRVDEVRNYLEKLEAELRELEITEERLANATTHLQEATDAL